MRTLFVLIKKQIVDDAPYFVGAPAVSGIVILGFGCLSFLYPEALPLHVFALLLALPALASVASFIFGIRQTHTERTTGTLTFVSVLPIRPNQILLSRVVSGALVILAVVTVLAIAATGGIVSGLLLWPDSLFPGGLVDLFVATFLVAMACYCLGLHVGSKSGSFSRALASLPLAIVLNLLIILKGLDGSLVCITACFIGAAVLWLLTVSLDSRIGTAAAGSMVLILLSIVLFLARYVSEVALVASLPPGAHGVQIYVPGLPVNEAGKDSKGVRVPALMVTGSFERFALPARGFHETIHYMLAPLGIIDYLQSRKPGGGRIRLSHFGSSYGKYFDRAKGLIVDRTARRKLYIGPEGMSETPDDSLGRFVSPVGAETYRHREVFFDYASNRFFAVDTRERTIRKGPELKDSTRRPVDIIDYYFRSDDCWVGGSLSRFTNIAYPRGCVAVLDESGQIDLLDLKTLNLTGAVGCLPSPQTPFGAASNKPKDILAYDIELIGSRPDREYCGLIAGSLSRQGTSMAVAVFDKEGNNIQTAQSNSDFRETGLGSAVALAKYAFESLHPPVLTLASFFTAYSFEARSAHRALFLMPNSFAAMVRDREGSIVITLAILLLVMLPGLALAGWLGWKVVKDASRLGLPQSGRRFWLAATIAFGLAGYITYRLTRPTITLVTCANCGKGRRPDMEICHHCGGKWEIPELTPPEWRIVGKDR